MRAEFVIYLPVSKSVEFRRANGRLVKVQLSDLDAESQALVLKLHEAEKAKKPEMQQRGRVHLEEEFKAKRWWKQWGMRDVPPNCELVSSDPEHGMAAPQIGRNALRVRINKGQHGGGSPEYRFRKEPERMYFRYYLLLGKNWQYNGKMPGWGGTYNRGGWGGRPSDGKNGWSARGSGYSAGDKFVMTTYCYHADMKGKYGDAWRWNHPGLEKGRWYCIE